ncbi:Hypothetical predicted protein, partial [Pelobates cultripes]
MDCLDTLIELLDSNDPIDNIPTTHLAPKSRFTPHLKDYKNIEVFLEMILSHDPTPQYSAEIKTLLNQALIDKLITKNEFDFMLVKQPVLSTFYSLPKVHKSLDNPSGRPIVSGCGNLTQNLSIYLDKILSPIEFVKILNKNDFDLRFTSELGGNQINFLDITITIKEGGLVQTTLFKKHTATNSLLNWTSYHPQPLKAGIPIGQYLRLRHALPHMMRVTARRGSNFRDTLVQSHLAPRKKGLNNYLPKGSYKCGHCSACEFMERNSKEFTDKQRV